MSTRAKMDELRARYLAARTESEKNTIFELIRSEMDADAQGVATAVLEQITETNQRARDLIVKEQLRDILPVVSLSFIAKEYFGKTKEWLYQRINSNTVNGKPARFTEDEVKTLNFALHDIAQKLLKISVS